MHFQVETVGPTGRKRQSANVREVTITLRNGATLTLRPRPGGNGVEVESSHVLNSRHFNSFDLTAGRSA